MELSALMLLWAPTLAPGAAPSVPSAAWSEPQTPPTPRSRALELENELGGLGFRFDAPVEVETLGSGEYGLACGAELERRFGPQWTELHHYVSEALGIDAGKNAAETSVRTAQAWFGASPVLYRTATRSIAVDSSRSAAGPELDHALARALVLAWRDRTSGFDRLFGEPRRTERVLVVSAFAAGEAEVAALALEEARAQRNVAKLDPAKLGPAAPKEAGELVRELCRAGRDTVLARVREKGWDSARSLFESLPASTEQLLHPAKLGSDAPFPVALPELPAELGLEILRDDSLGELGIQGLLVDAGVERAKALLGSIGWDGDRILLFRTGEGQLGVVWRVLFDRFEDVKQFGTAFTPNALGQNAARGFSVDWVRTDSVPLTQTLLALFAESKAGVTPDPAGQESTAEAEIDLRSAADSRPRLAGGWWIHPRFQLSVPAPEGWTMELLNGQVFLMGPPIEAFKDNLSVTALESGRGKTIDELVEQHTEAIRAQPGLVLEMSEKRVHDGREVAYVRYSGVAGANDLVFTRMLYLYGGRPIAITAAVAKSNWPRLKDAIDATFSGVRFHVPEPQAGQR
jgi:hypothetical protein